MMETSSTSSGAVCSFSSSPVTCSSASVSEVINDLDPMALPSNMLQKHPIGLMSVQDLHMLATANLIAQTQESIAQQYNITLHPSVEKSRKNVEQTPQKKSRSTERKNKRKSSKEEGRAKRHCTEQEKVGSVEDCAETNGAFHILEASLCTHDKKLCRTAESENSEAHKLECQNLVSTNDGNFNRSVKQTDCDGHCKLLKRQHPLAESCSRASKPTTCDKSPRSLDCQNSSANTSICRKKCDKTSTEHGEVLQPLECQHPGCNRKFMWPSHFRYHQMTHMGERNFLCVYEGCGQVFYTAQQLEVHQRTHNNNKPFSCPECSKAFTTAGNLKNHRRCHSGERPFACDYPQCSKTFAELSTLKKHKITHTGEKPYICEKCGKSFSQSSSRNVHMKSHNSEQGYGKAKTGGATGLTNEENKATTSNNPLTESCDLIEEQVMSEEQLERHIKLTLREPSNSICIVVVPQDQEYG